MLKCFEINYKNQIIVYLVLNNNKVMCKNLKLLKQFFKVQVNIYNIVIGIKANEMVCFEVLTFFVRWGKSYYLNIKIFMRTSLRFYCYRRQQ